MALAACVVACGVVSLGARRQQNGFFPVSEIRAGQVATGRTVFAGSAQEEFSAQILGVLRNVVGPGRDLIVARLSGGPLAQTGVIQGMSGSPVYIDGRLVGAVSYALGSFPREPIAGITPIAEMVDAMRFTSAPAAPGRAAGEFALQWPATPAQVFDALGRLARRAAAPTASPLRPSSVLGDPSLADWAPQLRPIGAAVFARGLTSSISAALDATWTESAGRDEAAPQSAALRPGDPVGMTFLRGDLEMGASGTVTWVDGARVYAFGHPFLNQGPVTFPMTQARVLTVLPSLESSMKIGEMGPVIGRVMQDRATGVAGELGAGPDELAVQLTLSAPGVPPRTLSFHVLHDEQLTPLFAFVSILNSLTAYERPAGVTTVTTRGTIDFGALGTFDIDQMFTGDTAITQAATTALTPIGAMASNTFRPVLPSRMALTLAVTEDQSWASVERAWLDTTRPRAGATHTLHVQLRQFRGPLETVSLPVTMPQDITGPITLVVGDAARMSALDAELAPTAPNSPEALFSWLRRTTRGEQFLYVRLLADVPGAVAAGQAQPALPASVRAIVASDTTGPPAALSRAVVGTWQVRTPRIVRGTREWTLTLQPAR
jgi:hypothetical protein